jgi:hypothetical protein
MSSDAVGAPAKVTWSGLAARARLAGAAEAVCQRMGMVRFKTLDAYNEERIVSLREAMGQNDFDATWAEGAGLSTEEAIAYAHVAAENASGRPAAGRRSPLPSATSRDWSRKVSPAKTLPHGDSSHLGPCKPT